MKRYEDWEKCLNIFLEDSRHKKFIRGKHDCVIFACDCIFVMTGIDFGAGYRGKYNNRKEASALLKKMGNKNLLDLAEHNLGHSLENVNYARRGDVVAIKYGNETALAVIDLTGRRAVTAGQEGLDYYKPKYWLKAWRV